MRIEVVRPYLDNKGKMTSKGDIVLVPNAYGHYLCGCGVARPYIESEVVRKPERGFEPSWSELRAKAKELGVFKVGMTKDEVKKAINDI